jgi:FkbM family methyltransferase
MIDRIYEIYRFFFARKYFIKFNKFLYYSSLRGLGILNYENTKVSGEYYFLKRYLAGKKGPVVLDVGANLGNYSMEVKRINNDAIIFAFEPHPITFQKLKKLADNNFKVYNLGCGKDKGKLKFYDYIDQEGSSHASIYKDVIEKIHKRKSKEYEVEIITVDDFIEQNSLQKVDLLKIDTEGNEYNVVIGSLRSINKGKVRAIHFEFNEMNVISRVYFKDFFELLPDYKFFRLLRDGFIPMETYDPLFCEVFAFQNVIAIKKEELAYLK